VVAIRQAGLVPEPPPAAPVSGEEQVVKILVKIVVRCRPLRRAQQGRPGRTTIFTTVVGVSWF